jgi:hypothetical protein
MFTSDNGTLSCITLAAQAFPPLAIPVTGAVDVLSDLVEAAHQYATEAKAPSTFSGALRLIHPLAGS